MPRFVNDDNIPKKMNKAMEYYVLSQAGLYQSCKQYHMLSLELPKQSEKQVNKIINDIRMGKHFEFLNENRIIFLLYSEDKYIESIELAHAILRDFVMYRGISDKYSNDDMISGFRTFIPDAFSNKQKLYDNHFVVLEDLYSASVDKRLVFFIEHLITIRFLHGLSTLVTCKLTLAETMKSAGFRDEFIKFVGKVAKKIVLR